MQIMAVIVDKFVSIQEVFFVVTHPQIQLCIRIYIVCGELIDNPTVNSP